LCGHYHRVDIMIDWMIGRPQRWGGPTNKMVAMRGWLQQWDDHNNGMAEMKGWPQQSHCPMMGWQQRLYGHYDSIGINNEMAATTTWVEQLHGYNNPMATTILSPIEHKSIGLLRE
jgi:hypothetical protein